MPPKPAGYMFSRFLEAVLASTASSNVSKHTLMMTVCHKDTTYYTVIPSASSPAWPQPTQFTQPHHSFPMGIPKGSCAISSATEERCSGSHGHAEGTQQRLGVQRWTQWTVLSRLRRSAQSTSKQHPPWVSARSACLSFAPIFWTSKYRNTYNYNLLSAGK